MADEQRIAAGLDIDDPPGCQWCGAMAGCCDSYPNCPNGQPTKDTTMRCKVRLLSITRTLSNVYRDGKNVPTEMQTLKMHPVTDQGGTEDLQFFLSTPTGSIELGVVNPAAVAGMEIGKSYYVDFTPAP